MGKDKQADETPEAAAQDVPAAPRTQRLDVLAAQLGYTPQFIPGLGGSRRATGMTENAKYSDFAAACVLKRWTEDTQVTQEQIEQAIAEVAAVTLR